MSRGGSFDALVTRPTMPSAAIASVVASIERAIDEARLLARRSPRIEDVVDLVSQMRVTREILLGTMECKSMDMEWMRDLLRTIDCATDELEARVARAERRLH